MANLQVMRKVVLPGNISKEEIGSIICDAYDVIEVSIPAGGSDVEVQVMPPSPEQINVLMIKANEYTDSAVPGTADLTYKPGLDSSAAVELNMAHLFTGKGQISVLESPPTILFFSNADVSNSKTVTILAGRLATP